MLKAIVTAETQRRLEQELFASGLDSLLLMERAGQAVANVVYELYSQRSIIVLVGTGNNGGDGFIIAEDLRERGVDVKVVAVNAAILKGDAFRAMQMYKGDVLPLSQLSLDHYPVIVDCLFGIGLNKPIEGEIAKAIHSINAAELDVVSTDIPSGIEADTGKVLGVAIRASTTVTFAYKKFGHMLLPGRGYCGEVVVADIGLDEASTTTFTAFENTPELWLRKFPWPKPEQHKYDRGHAIVVGGSLYRCGAAKLAATASLRTGAGLVSIACEEADAQVYAASALSLMTMPMSEWSERLKESRYNTILIGPGAGVNETTRERVFSALAHNKRVVLDADALTAFEAAPEQLFFAIQSPCIMTPHTGEFRRVFSALPKEEDKATLTVKAAKLSHAVVVHKGFDTVIAAPDGRVCVNINAPPELATAGAGDVLSGICAGLLAQGMDAFHAACAAVWLHSEAAHSFGSGLIAEDIIARLPQTLSKLKKYAIRKI